MVGGNGSGCVSGVSVGLGALGCNLFVFGVACCRFFVVFSFSCGR